VLLKGWRRARGVSQLQLAVDAGVSPRHLSFIETGRARPSSEMVLRLARRLQVPLREQNLLLLAAGHAPAHAHRALEEPQLQAVGAAARRFLDHHEPFPAVALDRLRNVVLQNRAAGRLAAHAAPALLRPPVNLFRLLLHPDGLSSRIEAFPAYARHLLARLGQDAERTGDAALHALLAELERYPGVEPSRSPPAMLDDSALVLRVRTEGGTLAFLTTLATFGTPFDVTVSELVLEALYPADEATAARLRDAAQLDEARI
jgi:transcriptional regulator with XRE-family HTH domain